MYSWRKHGIPAESYTEVGGDRKNLVLSFKGPDTAQSLYISLLSQES